MSDRFEVVNNVGEHVYRRGIAESSAPQIARQTTSRRLEMESTDKLGSEARRGATNQLEAGFNQRPQTSATILPMQTSTGNPAPFACNKSRSQGGPVLPESHDPEECHPAYPVESRANPDIYIPVCRGDTSNQLSKCAYPDSDVLIERPNGDGVGLCVMSSGKAITKGQRKLTGPLYFVIALPEDVLGFRYSHLSPLSESYSDVWTSGTWLDIWIEYSTHFQSSVLRLHLVPVILDLVPYPIEGCWEVAYRPLSLPDPEVSLLISPSSCD